MVVPSIGNVNDGFRHLLYPTNLRQTRLTKVGMNGTGEKGFASHPASTLFPADHQVFSARQIVFCVRLKMDLKLTHCNGPAQIRILIGAQITKKLPAIPYLSDFIQIKVGNDHLVFVFASFYQ